MLPLLIFAAARAAIPFTPINYRLGAGGLQELIQRLPPPLVIVDDRYRDMVGAAAKRVLQLRGVPGRGAHRRTGCGVRRSR